MSRTTDTAPDPDQVQTESLTLVQAVREGLHDEMERDDSVLVMGEDVGENGGVFRATQGLIDEFGEDRVVAELVDQALRGAEDAAVLADVLAHHEDAVVAFHLVV